jgi:hypothetical protein
MDYDRATRFLLYEINEIEYFKTKEGLENARLLYGDDFEEGDAAEDPPLAEFKTEPLTEEEIRAIDAFFERCGWKPCCGWKSCQLSNGCKS